MLSLCLLVLRLLPQSKTWGELGTLNCLCCCCSMWPFNGLTDLDHLKYDTVKLEDGDYSARTENSLKLYFPFTSFSPIFAVKNIVSC